VLLRDMILSFSSCFKNASSMNEPRRSDIAILQG
jgi:hypothetical protein